MGDVVKGVVKDVAKDVAKGYRHAGWYLVSLFKNAFTFIITLCIIVV